MSGEVFLGILAGTALSRPPLWSIYPFSSTAPPVGCRVGC